MNPDVLDRMLSGREDLVPSSGFVSNVMDAVRQEAFAQPPIPFPWKYALPGLAAAAVALLGFVFLVLGRFDSGSVRPAVPSVAPALLAIIEGVRASDLGWIAVALLVSFLSVRFSMRLTGSRV